MAHQTPPEVIACSHRTVSVEELIDRLAFVVRCADCRRRVEVDYRVLAQCVLDAGLRWTPDLQFALARWLLDHGRAPTDPVPLEALHA